MCLLTEAVYNYHDHCALILTFRQICDEIHGDVLPRCCGHWQWLQQPRFLASLVFDALAFVTITYVLLHVKLHFLKPVFCFQTSNCPANAYVACMLVILRNYLISQHLRNNQLILVSIQHSTLQMKPIVS